MKVRSVCVKLVVAAFLALMAPGLWAQDGLEGALSRANLASPLTGSSLTLMGSAHSANHYGGCCCNIPITLIDRSAAPFKLPNYPFRSF
jgi:hypothetical protein